MTMAFDVLVPLNSIDPRCDPNVISATLAVTSQSHCCHGNQASRASVIRLGSLPKIKENKTVTKTTDPLREELGQRKDRAEFEHVRTTGGIIF